MAPRLGQIAALGAALAMGCAKDNRALTPDYAKAPKHVSQLDGGTLVGACKSVDVDGDGTLDGRFIAGKDAAKLAKAKQMLTKAAEGVDQDHVTRAMAHGLIEQVMTDAIDELEERTRGGQQVKMTPKAAGDYIKQTFDPTISDTDEAARFRDEVHNLWEDGVKYTFRLSPLKSDSGSALTANTLASRYGDEVQRAQVELSIIRATELAEAMIPSTGFDCTQLAVFAYQNKGYIPNSLNALDEVEVPEEDNRVVTVVMRGMIKPSPDDFAKKPAVTGRDLIRATYNEATAAQTALWRMDAGNQGLLTSFDENFDLNPDSSESPNGLVVKFTPSPTE